MACHNKWGYMIFSSSPYVLSHWPTDTVALKVRYFDELWLLYAAICNMLFAEIFFLKMSERQTKAGNQITLSHSLTLSLSHSLTLNMLNNICFHVYAQKSLFKVENVNGFFLTSMVFFDKTLWTAPFPVSFRF